MPRLPRFARPVAVRPRTHAKPLEASARGTFAPSVPASREPAAVLEEAKSRCQPRQAVRFLSRAGAGGPGASVGRLGVAALFVTHDQSEALAVADRVAVLNEGRLEQVDAPQVVYTSPATPFVAEFVGVMNTVPVADGKIVAGAPEHAAVRPESLQVGAAGGLPGSVLTRTFLGAVTRLVVTTEVGELTVDAVSGPHLPGIGDSTTVGLAG